MQLAATNTHMSCQLRLPRPAVPSAFRSAGAAAASARTPRERLCCYAMGKTSASLSKRLHVYVSGRVQGVFFRNYTRSKALELGVTGWVRNRRDGRVEVTAEGNPEDLEALLKWLHSGSPEADVAGIESSWGTATEQLYSRSCQAGIQKRHGLRVFSSQPEATVFSTSATNQARQKEEHQEAWRSRRRTREVYCARCKPFDDVVAVKKLDLDANCNYDLTSLIREATLMRKLQHVNVLQLHTSFVVGRELWLVMPYMAHGSVRSIMKKQGLEQGLDEVVIASIMRSVLQGLDYVHQNGGIHRDIKADNILISEDGEVRLADFGVAAARARQVSMINLDMSAVMATTFVGTPCWMAPEVMAQDDGYNTSADIWSVGITMIELAQGRPPLSRAHPMRVLMDTINNPPPSLDAHFPKCFKEVVGACLCKDPRQRPSAAELLNFRFFRMAREPEFLVQHLLAGLEVQCEPRKTAAACAGGVCAADGVSSRAPSGLQPPQLLGGLLRVKSALGLQELVLGRIGSRLKSSWHFPPMQQLLLQAHHEDGQAEDQAATSNAAAELAAAAAAGQAAGVTHRVLPGVDRRDGSRLDAAADGAIRCGAGPSANQQSLCKNNHGPSVQQQQQQQQQKVTEQKAGCAEPVTGNTGTSVQGLDISGAEDEHMTCVKVQVLLAGAANSKQELQEHCSSLSAVYS